MPDNLPTGWRIETVASIASDEPNAVVGGPFGSNLVSNDYVPTGVPVIRGQNMASRFVGGDFVYVSEQKAASLSANLARPDDVVFTQRGTLGQVAIVPKLPYERYLISQSQMKLTVDRDRADPLFVYYAFSSPLLQNYIRRNATQAGVPHINLETLRELVILTPPIEEQESIAEVLGSLDDKIDLNHRTNKLLEAMVQAIFKAWFIDFEPVKAKAAGAASFRGMPQSIFEQLPAQLIESELGHIPTGWPYVPIGELVEVVGGSTPSTKSPEFWGPGEHPFCTPKDMSRMASPVLLATERQITPLGVDQISSGQLPAGTVLLSSRAPIGYLAITEIPVSVNQGIIAMLTGDIPNLYILLWTESNMDAIKARAGGSTFAEISKQHFRPLPVLRPPSAILSAFDSIVRPLYQRTVNNLRESNTLEQLRNELLPDLLSGRIRVR